MLYGFVTLLEQPLVHHSSSLRVPILMFSTHLAKGRSSASVTITKERKDQWPVPPTAHDWPNLTDAVPLRWLEYVPSAVACKLLQVHRSFLSG